MALGEGAAARGYPERKARILSESAGHGFMRLFRLMDEGRKIWLMTDPPKYEPDPKDSLYGQAMARGQDPWSFVYDALLQNQGKVMLYTPIENYAEDNLEC